MDEEDSWDPPWDCDGGGDVGIGFNGSLRDSPSMSFNFVPVKGHLEFQTAKKQLKFKEEEEEMEFIPSSPSEVGEEMTTMYQEPTLDTAKGNEIEQDMTIPTKKVKLTKLKALSHDIHSYILIFELPSLNIGHFRSTKRGRKRKSLDLIKLIAINILAKKME